jgi:RNase P/RNase MRP subunit p30
MIDLVFIQDLQLLTKNAEKFEVTTYIIAKEFTTKKEIQQLKEQTKKQKFPFLICAIPKDPQKTNELHTTADLIAMRGGNPQKNKQAVDTKNNTLLISPEQGTKPATDTAIARTSKQKNIPIAFLFSDYQKQKNTTHATLIRNTTQTTELLKKFNTNPLFFSGATNENELKKPKDLTFWAKTLGTEPDKAKKTNIEFEKKLRGTKK